MGDLRGHPPGAREWRQAGRRCRDGAARSPNDSDFVVSLEHARITCVTGVACQDRPRVSTESVTLGQGAAGAGHGHQYVAGVASPAPRARAVVIDPASAERVVDLDLASPPTSKAPNGPPGPRSRSGRRRPRRAVAGPDPARGPPRELADERARWRPAKTGMPIRLSTEFDVPGTVDNTAFLPAPPAPVGLATGDYSPDTPRRASRSDRGRGSIDPWKYRCRWPLEGAARRPQATPSWQAQRADPLTSLMLAEAAATRSARRVINIAPAPGRGGEALVATRRRHGLVHRVGAGVGRRVMSWPPTGPAARRVHLELGGKRRSCLRRR